MELQKNQLVTIEILDMSSDGEGIGKLSNGFPIFVKDAIIGDLAEVRIIKLKKNYGYGRLEKVLKPSPFRIEPVCSCHRQCGGCQIQAMSYERQLTFKQDKVRNNLIRIGGFQPELIDQVMEPILGMETPFRYRNKAQYPIGTDKDGNPIAGFYAGRTHNIISNTECVLGSEENKEILEVILTYMRENHVPAYDEVTGKGLIRHVLIRKGFATGEIMVCVVINFRGNAGSSAEVRGEKGGKQKGRGKYLPAQNKLIEALQSIPGMTSISVSINTEKTNVIMGQEIHTLWGSDVIHDTIRMPGAEKEIDFAISPLSFYQVNPRQTEKLYGLALEYADLTGSETVWDLYCGIGTISLFLAQKAGKVYGVEIIPQAIEDARNNARRNGITNTEFLAGKAEEVLPEKYEKEGISADVIVVDPPRKGCDEACLDTMLKMKPERIVYVSCDSATLARDLKMLCEGGYEVKKVRAVDMFGMTVHVETVALLTTKSDTPKLEVTMDVKTGSNYQPVTKATYGKIKEYVMNKYGVDVHTRYIAEVKRMCGIEMGENYNKSKKENPDIKHCPPDKVKYIMEALKYFGAIAD